MDGDKSIEEDQVHSPEESDDESTDGKDAAKPTGSILNLDDDDEGEDEVRSNNKKRIVEDDDDEDDDEENIGHNKPTAGIGNNKDSDDEADSDDNSDDDDDDDDDDGEENDNVKNKKDTNKEVEEEEEEEEEEEDDDDEDEVEPDDRGGASQRSSTQLSDFDIMMAKKKEENSRKRKRRNYDIIDDNDDIIADIINQMKDAVEADSEANKNRMAATKKLKLLPFVINQLRKVDLRDAFLDSDVLSVITEWLAPLPDRSLPHLNIRESLLKILIDFNLYDVDRIKASGIGKAVMYLHKHPKETKENKQRAKQLISCWSRPIFQLDSSFSSISREEREQRDLELMSKQRRVSKQQDSSDGEGAGPSGSGQRKHKDEQGAQKPGDKGWIPRARVPAPSMKDYVVRPRSKVDGDIGKSSKRPSNMLEKYMKNQQDRRRASRQQRAINMKIDRG